MPHTTTLPPHYLRATTKGGKGVIWVNLDRALTINTSFDSPKHFAGFTIEFEENAAIVEVTDKAEVRALAKLLDYTIPGSE